MPLILDGRSLAKKMEVGLSERVATIVKKTNRKPILATILVEGDPASATYVRMKQEACKRIGIESAKIVLPKETTTRELLNIIDLLNEDKSTQGILLQHPLPRHINERICFDRIAVEKDVDGVTSFGFGRMSMKELAFGSATPTGIMRLLQYNEIRITGKEAVVIGRSPILGKPMAMMLLNADATVTICHSRTENLPDIVIQADIIVAAVGRPEFIKGAWIKKGAVVIDAGYHPNKVGDVELSQAILRCSAYTPVPGGVGPMTIISLLSNTVEAAEVQLA